MSKQHTISQKDVVALKNGDTSAFDRVYWEYSAHIYNFAKSVLYSESQAKDITQTVFMQIWEKRENIDLDQNFQAYMFAIARNQICKESLHRVMYDSLSDMLDVNTLGADNTTEKEINFKFTAEIIEALIDKMPTVRKEIFKMSRFKHMSNKEIAEKMGISERTVETQIYRSLLFLKKESGVLLTVLLYKFIG